MTAERRLQQALLLLDREQSIEAETILRALMAPAIGDEVERVRAHVILGEHFACIGRESEARALYTAAIEMSVSDESRVVLELEIELARDLLAALA